MSRSHRQRRRRPSARPQSPRHPRSYTPLSDALRQPLTFADTELAQGLRRHRLPGLLAGALGRARRSGAEPLANLLCALLVWPLLQAKSIHCFCAQLCQILQGKVSVLYDFLGREDINWRGLPGQLYRYQGRDYTAHQLYARVRRRMRPGNRRARFKTASLIVSLNLQTEARGPAYWVKVRLVFSAPVRAASADTWVVFLCTDPQRSEASVLQAYALRWSIEVYFKEVKQNLGFLKEQSGRYQVAYASVHLAAVRYLLLFEAMLRQGRLSYGEIRDRETGRLQVLTYATLLWQLLRSLIEGALDGLVRQLGRRVINKVLAAIDQGVEGFLEEALQISAPQVAVQLQAEALGYL